MKKNLFEEIKKLMQKMHEQGYEYVTIAEMVSGYAYKMTYDPAMQGGDKHETVSSQTES